MTEASGPDKTERTATSQDEFSEDKGHQYHGSLETESRKPEKKGVSLKTKVGVGLAAAVVLIGGGSVAAKKAMNPGNSTATGPVPTNTGEAQPPLSAEAQKFVDLYGDRYADPVSTYYASKDYVLKANIPNVIMADNYIDNFEINGNIVTGVPDEIGFTQYTLPLDAKFNQQTSIKVFNEYTVPSLNCYMNELAKNPSPEAKKIIKAEFAKYCSDISNEDLPIAFTSDDKGIAMLMDTADALVSKYGSTANYYVAPAEINSDDEGVTSFDGATMKGYYMYDDREIQYFSDNDVRLVIGIDVFKGDKSSHITETINEVQLQVIRQPGVYGGTESNPDQYTNISIGQQ